MDCKTMGEVISARRKALGLTQNELAGKMGVTDKAVSKWERNLSCPDLASIPRLAEVLGVSLEELLNTEQPTPEEPPAHSGLGHIVDLALLGVGLAEGVAMTALSVINQADSQSGWFAMLGIGLSCLGIYLLRHHQKE